MNNALNNLFPKAVVCKNPPRPTVLIEWEDDWDVTFVEIYRIIKKGKLKNNTAPGPDGIRSSYWKKVNDIMMHAMAKLLTLCIKEHKFPDRWKLVHLVLLSKGKLCMELPKVRPICLLDEAGKILEKVLVKRITDWMDDHPESVLTPNQFGFCRGKSTIDALIELINFIEFAHRNEGIAVAISLDIANAFNSLQWKDIKSALRGKNIPEYICQIIDSYLSNRYIEFPTDQGLERRVMETEVPQGSVLGPLLWNVTYDQVLRGITEDGCRLIGYADDTLILVAAENMEIAVRRAEIQTALTIRKIRELNLRVATEKPEIVTFENKKEPGIKYDILIEDKLIQTKSVMKYLGVMIDEKLKFLPHIKYIQEKVSKVTGAPCKIMPNLRDPHE